MKHLCLIAAAVALVGCTEQGPRMSRDDRDIAYFAGIMGATFRMCPNVVKPEYEQLFNSRFDPELDRMTDKYGAKPVMDMILEGQKAAVAQKAVDGDRVCDPTRAKQMNPEMAHIFR